MTFANFDTTCGNKRDYILSTSSGNDDGQHPVEMSDTTLLDVVEDSKLFFHRPNVGYGNCTSYVTVSPRPRVISSLDYNC